MSRYDSYIANSKNNILNNPKIKEGSLINYFNDKCDVFVEKIDTHRKVVVFKKIFVFDSEKKKEPIFFWDYFMDANVMVV